MSNTANAGESKKIDSEKSKDIRSTNIIAAKGKSPLTLFFACTLANPCLDSISCR